VVTVGQIYNFIDSFAPFHTAMSFDNVGLLIGEKQRPVTCVIVSMDITPEVVSEAIEKKAELIISHHPVIFQPLKHISPTDVPYLLIKNDLCAIAAHTNYDLACGGINTCLAQCLHLSDTVMLEEYQHSGLASSLIGELKFPMESKAFALYVKEQLQCGGVKFTQGRKSVKKVAVACGAGSSSVFAAVAAGADAFVSGDSKHHELLAADSMGITMVDAGHFATEDIAIMPLCRRLTVAFPEVNFFKSRQKDPVRYLV